jgi:hypothetical protein
MNCSVKTGRNNCTEGDRETEIGSSGLMVKHQILLVCFGYWLGSN